MPTKKLDKTAYPTLPPETGPHADKVMETLASIRDQPRPIAELAQWFEDVRVSRDALKQQMSAKQVYLDALEVLILEWLEQHDLTNVKTVTGSLLYLNEALSPQVIDPQALRAWIVKNKMDALLSVQFQTLGRITRERAADGQPTPDGVDIYIRRSLSLRKG